MTSSILSVIEQQTRWARSKGFEPRNAYLMSLADNLRQQLSTGALTDYERGSGGELRERGIRPPKMHALRSSAALSVNVFDYWRTCDPGPLQYALDLRERITRVSFEEQFPTGLRGNPPNVDVLLTLEENRYVAIESKFTEWLTPRDRTIDPKYFPRGLDLWARENLPNCQALADTMKDDAPFKFLDVPQLLKHALGIARKKVGSYELCYIYFDLNCPESELHAAELARFAELVGSEIRFRALTYQGLFRRLSQAMRTDDAPYMDYLIARYSQN